ncbi:uncharacterized protein LMUH8_0298 [Listeria monocytogenes]|nr:uncharacterized protein LMMT_0298 [Listeria monocytogenes]QNK13540.1 uncharacterized protein LMCH_0298 [Listeria monocytogenes]QNK16346.1 uncharacterized protein LMMA_0299 [Listeria monocytogenes]QNK19148.1 uncharacterized protein LMSS_0298 [Listeria monocytogenes]QNK22119.1 uncharacterized protein LMUH4_0297 [Listeria monocytogenes]
MEPKNVFGIIPVFNFEIKERVFAMRIQSEQIKQNSLWLKG